MSLPVNTSNILDYLGFTVDVDYSASSVDGVVALAWLSQAAQPTEQEIIDAGASQEFSDWRAEHGGDAALTLRRQAREAIDESRAESAALRAAIIELINYTVTTASNLNALLDGIDAAISLAQIKAAAALINNQPTPTLAQAMNAIKARIAAGEAD